MPTSKTWDVDRTKPYKFTMTDQDDTLDKIYHEKFTEKQPEIVLMSNRNHTNFQWFTRNSEKSTNLSTK